MKKSERTKKKLTSRTPARMKKDIQASTPEPRTKPKTYEVMQIDSDDELGVVRMTAREIFEQNCAGETPEAYDSMDEGQIRSKMHAQASHRVLLEDIWHPDDVGTIAEACTDYIMEFREMKKLDTTQMHSVRVPATPVPRKKS